METLVLEGLCVVIGSVLAMSASLGRTMLMMGVQVASFDPSSQFSCESKLL